MYVLFGPTAALIAYSAKCNLHQWLVALLLLLVSEILSVAWEIFCITVVQWLVPSMWPVSVVIAFVTVLFASWSGINFKNSIKRINHWYRLHLALYAIKAAVGPNKTYIKPICVKFCGHESSTVANFQTHTIG